MPPPGASSTAPQRRSAIPARSKRSVPRVPLGARMYRHVGEEYLERVRAYQETSAYQKALRKRQVWVEPFFAEAKDWHGLRRFRLRRLWRVNCEALALRPGRTSSGCSAGGAGGGARCPAGRPSAGLFFGLMLGVCASRSRCQSPKTMPCRLQPETDWQATTNQWQQGFFNTLGYFCYTLAHKRKLERQLQDRA